MAEFVIFGASKVTMSIMSNIFKFFLKVQVSNGLNDRNREKQAIAI